MWLTEGAFMSFQMEETETKMKKLLLCAFEMKQIANHSSDFTVGFIRLKCSYIGWFFWFVNLFAFVPFVVAVALLSIYSVFNNIFYRIKFTLRKLISLKLNSFSINFFCLFIYQSPQIAHYVMRWAFNSTMNLYRWLFFVNFINVNIFSLSFIEFQHHSHQCYFHSFCCLTANSLLISLLLLKYSTNPHYSCIKYWTMNSFVSVLTKQINLLYPTINDDGIELSIGIKYKK